MNIPDYDRLNGGSVSERSIQIHYPEFHQYILNNFSDELSWSEKLYWYYNKLTNFPTCPVCGSITKFINIKEGYRKYCSRKCLNCDPDKKEKTKQTCLDKYGGVAPACSEEIRSKYKKTCLEKYGVKNVMQNKNIANKSHKTNIERYGECGNASPELKKKQKETLNRLFGSNNYMQSEYFYDIISKRHPDILSIDIINKRYECLCPDNNCNKCSKKTYYISIKDYGNRKNMTGIYKCTISNPIKDNSNRNTSIELFIRSILDRNNISYITNIRNIITPLELDIYIPSRQLAIECNGIYYHNSLQKEHNYHYNKYKLCEMQGIQLLSFWEDWIYKKPEIIENILLSKLGIYKERIYARKCKIKKLNTNDSGIFLNSYHLQGSCPADIKYGLYYNDILVSVMTFANHRNNIISTKGWELTRFCSLPGVQVTGGAEKLLTHFIREYNPTSIVSFSMNDISNGNLYKKLGFEKDTINQSYWYVDDNFKRYHRSSFTKNSIIKKGWKNNKEGWTESEIMKEPGYSKIYDSGQTKWVFWNN